MSEVKRVFLETTGEGAGTLIEAPGGDLVAYSDYAALEASRDRWKRLAKAQRGYYPTPPTVTLEELEAAEAALLQHEGKE